MKKIVFFIVITFVLQMFCGSVFGQNSTYDPFGTWQVHGHQLLLHPKDQKAQANSIIEGGLRLNTSSPWPGIDALEMWGGLGSTVLGFSVLGTVSAPESGKIGLLMSNGRDYGFQLYFPRSYYGRWNRIITAENSPLSFSTGNRGISNDSTDLFINPVGNVGIGTSSPTEKLMVSGNIIAENYKLANGKITSGIRSEAVSIATNNPNNVIDFHVGSLSVPDFTMLRPVGGDSYPLLSIAGHKGRIIAQQLEFSTGVAGILDGNTPPNMVIMNNGNVGIGTDNPTEKLTVGGGIRLKQASHITGDFGLNFNCPSNYPFDFNFGNINRFSIRTMSNGDLLLQLVSSAFSSARIVTGYGNSLSFATGNRGGVYGNDSIDLHINTIGNVGIGTNEPSEKLTVAGNAKIDNGKLFININPDNIDTTIKNQYSVFATGGILSEDYAIAPQSTWADHVFNADYQLQNLNEIENYINTNKHLPGIPSAAQVQENGYTLHDMNVKLLQKVEELTLYSIEQNKKIEQLESVVKSYQTLLEKVEQLENKIK